MKEHNQRQSEAQPRYQKPTPPYSCKTGPMKVTNAQPNIEFGSPEHFDQLTNKPSSRGYQHNFKPDAFTEHAGFDPEHDQSPIPDQSRSGIPDVESIHKNGVICTTKPPVNILEFESCFL